MSILELGSLQLTLFAMMLIGALLNKEGHHRRKRQKVPGRPLYQCGHPVQHL
ncbi:hypothetical protein [Oscillibacter sp. ER4]|uniref:hypothetical protein n=1 Tax=Oscillibacter sp. ER4 TaxID=1519439 RepID=UPI000A7D03FC|nr:hypothetical protein [Oscillibacter sp. ER4]